MNFRKISAKERIYIETKNKYEQIYNDFEHYMERLTYSNETARPNDTDEVLYLIVNHQ